MTRKYCPECRLYLEIDKFKKLKTRVMLKKYPDGYYWCCSECYKEKEWVFTPENAPNNRRNRRRHKRALRLEQVKYKYGLSEEAYEEMAAEQENVCAICKGREEKKVLCVDHNHSTGRVRGLLCNNCNIGLGNFKDNPEILQTAIAYVLEKGGNSKE